MFNKISSFGISKKIEKTLNINFFCFLKYKNRFIKKVKFKIKTKIYKRIELTNLLSREFNF